LVLLVGEALVGPVFLWLGFVLALLLAGFALAYWRPDWFVRLLAWIPVHLLYRMRVYGREVIPATGPVLFVCNHVSYIDAFLVFMAQRRPIRFVMWAPYMRVPGLRLLLKLSGAIPVDGSAGPRAIVQSLRLAGEALARGEAVCIFAEGGITWTGFLLPF